MLTIISVSFHSKELLEANYNLVKVLNPGASFRWIVVQNTPEGDIEMNDPRFIMIRGPELTQLEKESSFSRSIHHAKALNLALSYTDSDFILTLDPDCFLLYPNWIEQVLQHMKKEALAFFGVPYHPKYFTHYRGFPSVICMFINRRLMQEKNYFSLDFTPDFEGRILLNAGMHSAILYHAQMHLSLRLFFSSKTRMFPLELYDCHRVIKRRIKEWLHTNYAIELSEKKFDLLQVGSCRDTGYKIFKQYHKKLKHEIVQVFARDKRHALKKALEFFLPDMLRTFPRWRGYLTHAESPLFESFGNMGEQFFWKEELFGFHLKGVADNISLETKNRLKTELIKEIYKFISFRVKCDIPQFSSL